MPVPNKAALTGRGWEEGDLFPAEFFYPTKSNYPHLHLSCGLNAATQDTTGNWDVAYLGYHEADKAFVIVNQSDGTNDPNMAANLPTDNQQIIAEAQFAATLAP